jgi:hypothetical protein
LVGLFWFGLVWFGLVWFGLVWFGLVYQYTYHFTVTEAKYSKNWLI